MHIDSSDESGHYMLYSLHLTMHFKVLLLSRNWICANHHYYGSHMQVCLRGDII